LRRFNPYAAPISRWRRVLGTGSTALGPWRDALGEQEGGRKIRVSMCRHRSGKSSRQRPRQTCAGAAVGLDSDQHLLGRVVLIG
jgi:hypothetical protein